MHIGSRISSAIQQRLYYIAFYIARYIAIERPAGIPFFGDGVPDDWDEAGIGGAPPDSEHGNLPPFGEEPPKGGLGDQRGGTT